MLSIHSSPLARLGGKEAGGMNVYVRELARSLAAAGHTIDIVTRQQAPDWPAQVALTAGAQVLHVLAGPPQPYDKNRILEHLPQLLRQLEQHAAASGGYDLIHSHYWVSGKVGLSLRERWRVPLVQMFHTLGAMKNQVARSRDESETDQRYQIEYRLMQQADALVAATPLDYQQMQRLYTPDTAPVQIIPCGVDVVQFAPQPRDVARARLGVPPHQQLIICIGRMEPLKGMDALIRAAALLRQPSAGLPATGEHLRVLLIGGEPEDQPANWNTEQRRLDALRHRLGVAAVVQFAGAQPHERLPDYYAAADVLAVPSHYESFGLVALEGLACGAAVVASAVGGLTVTIEDGRSGLLVPPDDAPALAAALQRVLTDAALRAGLQQHARERALGFRWSAIADQTAALYRALLGRA